MMRSHSLKIHRLCLLTLFILTASWAWANIPSGQTIYIKVSGEWNCHASYFVFLSGKNTSYLMQPTPNMPGVYQFVTKESTQDNLRFCYSDVEYTTDQQGQMDPHTNDITGWSAAKPCYDFEALDWGVASAGTVEPMSITSLDISLETNCADSTYTVIATVTFEGEPCAITMEGTQMVRTIKRTSPSSPFVYTLRGLDATEATGLQSMTATIYSDGAAQTVADTRTETYQTPDFLCEVRHPEETLCLGETKTFTATTKGKAYLWSTGATTEQIDVTFTTDSTIWCMVFDTIRKAKNNLMVNGDFEEELNPTSGFSSDYKYAGFDVNQYYNHKTVGDDNLYGITHDANYFWRDFASIEPHGGNYYAIFDAGKSGDAWRAETDAINTKLTALKDSVYTFSYWAAYPNNKPNHSPARLQFYIAYYDEGGQMHEQQLGTEVTLGQQADLNAWEFHEVQWKAPCTSNHLIISVRDKNNEHSGNDFCLDDIMFQNTSFAKRAMMIKDVYPIRVQSCTYIQDTICLGETYTKHGYNLTPTHAGDTAAKNSSSYLSLHVVAPIAVTASEVSAICNFHGGTIAVPFTITSGTPITYSMTASAADVTPVSDAAMPSQEFSVSIPTPIISGSRTLTFTFANKEQRCNDQQLQVTLTFLECKGIFDTTCVGQPYDKGGFRHPADQPGTFKVENGSTDTLYLTVLINPEVSVESILRSECDITSAEVDIPYTIVAGRNLQYVLTINDLITPQQGVLDGQPFHVTIPQTGLNRTFNGSLQYQYMNRCSSTTEFTIRINNGQIPVYRKWDNVLFVNNGQDQYTTYQWYCNDQAIAGATEQALYTGQNAMLGDGNTYYVMLTRTDGTKEQSCVFTFDEVEPSAPLNPGDHPTPVSQRQVYRVGPSMYVVETTYSDGSTQIQKVIEP